jgi:hypothetical protein
MKKFFLLATMLLTIGEVSAQIAEVKQDGRRALIINDQGTYTGNYISLCPSCELNGYNSKYIVITDGRRALIYNEKGSYTGNYISLCPDCYIKNVSGTAILLKDGARTLYYDFKGSYTGNYTTN